MNLVVWNIVLALVWAATTEEFSARNFTVGMALGFGLLYFTREVLGPSDYFRNVKEFLTLIWYFVRELFIANLRMAYYVVMPLNRMRPGIIGVPLEPMSDLEITALANLLTLTPGTLSVDVSEDKRTLYVHVMYYRDRDAFQREIKEGFEARVIRGLRSQNDV